MNDLKALDSINQIRSLMERSSHFVSLSGLSGIIAGVIGLIGISLVYLFLDISPFSNDMLYFEKAQNWSNWGLASNVFIFLNGLAIFVLAFIGAFYFTHKRAKKKGLDVWSPIAKRLFINTAIPLLTGAAFCLGLLHLDLPGLLAPSTLIFYGLACINGSKFTRNEIKYLGLTLIILGIICMFNLAYGLEFWALGFGLGNIFYGALMYFKQQKD